MRAMTYRKLAVPIVALVTAIAGTVALAPVAGAGGGAGSTRPVPSVGTTSYSPTADGADPGFGQPELGPGLGEASSNVSSHNRNGVNRSRSIQHTAPGVTTAPIAAGVGVSSAGPLSVLTSFDGLNHRNQRLANGGNQFSLEPPDQGLCAGNGVEMEIINDVMKIYSSTGATVKSTLDLNTFFGYPAQFNRTTGLVGPFVTDPSCLYDSATNRWFVDVLTLDVFPSTGDFTGANHLDLAVSNSGDPTGTWTIYRVQVQDDGNNGTPNHSCTGVPPFGSPPPTIPPTFVNACFGDYPHLGADANGVYLTTNEYSLFGPDFHGAQIYAFSKAALVSGAATVDVTQIDTHGLDNGNSGFTLWPAVAPAGMFNTSAGGTEYFMSSNAADEAHGNGVAVGPRRSTQLLVWTLSNTSSLGTTPSLNLDHKTLSVGLYVVPPRSQQKVGNTPLIDCLNMHSCSTNFLLGVPDPFAPEHEYDIDSNDTRMQQVVYANGRLWGALDTAVNSSANTRAGVEWFVVNPAGGGSIVNQGYLAVSQNNAIYPAIAVTPSGHGVMAFTLVGRGFYPSAAFASIDAGGVGAVQLAAVGLGPADGFTGTAAFNAPNPARPRWGDYGAAVVDGSNIWIASEYIGQTCTLSQYLATGASCGGTRTVLANWDTRITQVNPAG
jgi:hypothetical protein